MRRYGKRYLPKGSQAKDLDTIPEEEEVPELRFHNFITPQRDDFLRKYKRRPISQDMRQPLHIRMQNLHCTNDLLRSMRDLKTDRIPSDFPRSIVGYVKNIIYQDQYCMILNSNAIQYGLGGGETRVMLKEVFLSSIIGMHQNNPVNLREILKGLTLELYILHALRHNNFTGPLKIYPEVKLGRYHIAFVQHVPLRLVMNEQSRRTPERRSFFDGIDIPRYIAKELLAAVTFLFQHRISQTKLTASNVYITKDGTVRLGDFQQCVRYLPPQDSNQRLSQLTYNRVSQPYMDVFNVGVLYAKMTIPYWLDSTFPQEVFADARRFNTMLVALMRSFDRRYNQDPTSNLPVSRQELDFLMGCLTPDMPPWGIAQHQYLLETPAETQQTLSDIVEDLGFNLAGTVMTGPYVQPLGPARARTPFEVGRPMVELKFLLEETTSLNTFRTGYLVDVYDSRYWFHTLFDLMETERPVQVRAKYNFEPSDALAIHVFMEELMADLSRIHYSILLKKPTEAVPSDAIKVSKKLKLGHDQSRHLTITARVHSIKGLNIEVAEDVSPRITI